MITQMVRGQCVEYEWVWGSAYRPIANLYLSCEAVLYFRAAFYAVFLFALGVILRAALDAAEGSARRWVLKRRNRSEVQ